MTVFIFADDGLFLCLPESGLFEDLGVAGVFAQPTTNSAPKLFIAIEFTDLVYVFSFSNVQACCITGGGPFSSSDE